MKYEAYAVIFVFTVLIAVSFLFDYLLEAS